MMVNSGAYKAKAKFKTPASDAAPVGSRAGALRLIFPRSSPAQRLLFGKRRFQKILREVWAAHGQPAAEVEVNLVDTPAICRLHQDYLGDPTPTDIITFDLGLSPEGSRLAALYICIEVAERYAQRYRVAPREEIRRLVIHGMLHLLGYDDHTPSARRRMRRQENQILKLVHE